ncbi:MAG: hypothetical protein AB1Z29_11340 [Desulfobacterales bacterium]
MSSWQNYMEEHREQYVGELTEFLGFRAYRVYPNMRTTSGGRMGGGAAAQSRHGCG